jgi:hypothetical protein
MDAAKSAQQQGWVAERAEKPDEAAGHYQRAIEWLLEAEGKGSNLEEKEAATLERYRAIVAQGDAMARRAEKAATRAEVEEMIAAAQSRYDRAQTEYWAPRLAAEANDEEAKRTLSTLASKRAAIGTSRGRAAIDEADRLLKGLAPGSAVPTRAAELLIEAAQRFDEAIARATPVLERFGDLASDAPASGAAERDIYVACNTLGLAISGKADVPKVLFERLGLTTLSDDIAQAVGGADGTSVERTLRERAAAVYGRGLRIAVRLADNDPRNIEAQRDWAVMLNKTGNEQRWLARLIRERRDALLADAMKSYAASLDLRLGLLRTDGTARHVRDVGLAEFKLGQIHRALADTRQGAERAASLAEAERFMSGAGARFEELRTKYRALADDAAPIVETREALEEIRVTKGR